MLKEQCGLSPLLATLILIGATVVAGFVAYAVFFDSSTILSSKLTVQASVGIIKTSDMALISATVKNTGTKPIVSCNVTVYYNETCAEKLSFGALQPEEVRSAEVATKLGFAAGERYVYRVEAIASDNSTFVKASSVEVVGG